MEKTVITMALVAATLLNAETYTGNGEFTADSKNSACSGALQKAKGDAMEQAGTLVFSNFESTISDDNSAIDKYNKDRLITSSLGVAKLKTKSESVEVDKNYQFTCKVKADFDIDADELKDTLTKMIEEKEKQKHIKGYFTADGYSEDGQSKYKAFTSATAIAQRNLLETVNGANLTSLIKIDSGKIESDKVGKLIDGTLKGAEIVKKEYDPKTKSAYVQIRIKKEAVVKALEEAF
jgi:hypothetical protein